MKRNLQLYVWTDFCPDYTRGLAFAIASSEEEARKLIFAKGEREPYDWGCVEVRPLDQPTCEYVYGGS